MKTYITIIMAIFCISSVYSQNFLDGNFTFSNKKESYLTLKDGTEITGTISDIDRKKGLIEEITIKNDKGKKISYKPEDIKFMYIAPSGYDKFSNAYSKMNDLTELNKDRKVNMEHIKEGYALFESTEVLIKKKKMTLLLQLLNPGFANKIRVYFNPYASESASLELGGFKVAGGDAKSYYFKKGDDVAYLLQKKNYEDEFEHLFGDCPELKKEFAKKLNWGNVEKHVYYYTESCK